MTNLYQTNTQVIITRIFDAPRELVFKAWTDPSYITRWWGPKSFTAPFCKIDLRTGGSYLYCMKSPEGQDFWSTGIFRELVVPERIVYTDRFADEKGTPVPASYYGMEGDWPEELLVTVVFEDLGKKTKLTLVHTGFPPGRMKELAAMGWNESLDKFAESFSQ
ncbi:hypothetical protein LEP1GSC050_0159 [Leptospira broomii serovar Hurstbridge str. 5399]|uniref:Activator of Hsp90 ATPase homologue 1/2-like C-terminal domain-containing protein n=1 Tax=Leptospira broomii serovar Hurstbridge str. 5399 TaxID=1049789 RepID=T0GLT5_9LEPT|nr:SRPBCC domain-containing protein [Leptospira broomii]EQA46328.1 hypothetical protein LEP1GSC050_0159 [Leptospira broomii serovar Hurstbridge str. 5399]